MSAPDTDRWSGASQPWAEHAARIDADAAPITEALLAQTSPQDGETVLEIGAGPGGVGLRAAGLVGPRGRVLLTDRSPAMLEIARARARKRKAENVETEVCDAMALTLADGIADVAVSRFAFQAMDDPGRAFAEALRVLRPGGRLAVAVWGSAERNPWAELSMRLFRELTGTPSPAPGEPGIFGLADGERLHALLSSAGFADVRVEHVGGEQRYDDFEDWWRMRRELPPGDRQTWESLDDGARADAERIMRERVRPFGDGGGLAFPSEAIVAAGRRPEER